MGRKDLTLVKNTNISLESLDENKKKEIISIKNSITMDYENTLDYASQASKNLTDFSSDLLKTMKVKDTPEVEGLIMDLMAGLEKVDATTLMEKKSSFIKKLFKVDEFKQFITRYEDVASVIDGVKVKLEESNFQLKKDIEVCNRYLEQNLEYINELDNYILAGKVKVDEERISLEEDRKTLDSSDMLNVHNFNARENEIDRLDRKIHDLELMRGIAVQNIPQIMLIRDGDGVLIEKIQSSINSAIPLWESQMVIAIQLMRQKGALAIQKGVADTTNNLISKNSELLKSGSVEVAKELERGIIDIDVLKKNSDNLIKTLEAIRAVRQEGKENRLKATQELAVLQTKLNEQLLLSEG